MSLIVDQKAAISRGVHMLAEEHGISSDGGEFESFDELADCFTRLSGDPTGKLDQTQLLIIALRRAGVLAKNDAMRLQADYLVACNAS